MADMSFASVYRALRIVVCVPSSLGRRTRRRRQAWLWPFSAGEGSRWWGACQPAYLGCSKSSVVSVGAFQVNRSESGGDAKEPVLRGGNSDSDPILL